VKKFPAFYGIPSSVTVFKAARLSWARLIQSRPPNSFPIISFNTIIPTRPGLPSRLLHSCDPTKTLYASLISLLRATCQAHLVFLGFVTWILLGEEYRALSSSLCNYLPSSVTSALLGPNAKSKLITVHLSIFFLLLLSLALFYLPVHSRCPGFLWFHFITLKHTSQSVGLLWMRDRPVAETST
jgi:hypothetical protein